MADLVLHVVDASVPEVEMDEMLRAVDSVLDEIGAGDRPRLLVLNKADALDDERREELRFAHPDGILVSALTGAGIDELGERVEHAFRRDAALDRPAAALRRGRPAGRAARARRRARAHRHGRGRPRPRPRPGHRGRALRALRGRQRRPRLGGPAQRGRTYRRRPKRHHRGSERAAQCARVGRGVAFVGALRARASRRSRIPRAPCAFVRTSQLASGNRRSSADSGNTTLRWPRRARRPQR